MTYLGKLHFDATFVQGDPEQELRSSHHRASSAGLRTFAKRFQLQTEQPQPLAHRQRQSVQSGHQR
jgi:hypothetical protein